MPHASTAVMPMKEPKTFAEIGAHARKRAQRAALLKSLRAFNWNLTATATALEMGNHANVLRAIRDLELDAEYNEAKRAGLIGPGNRVRRAA